MHKKSISFIAVAIFFGILADTNASPVLQFDEHGHGDLHDRSRGLYEGYAARVLHPVDVAFKALPPPPARQIVYLEDPDARISSAALASLGG
ncbi:hypothetical protein WA026_003513 [Henosepilachna vigintioctopunctata]|uniref:Uncharacterized protein n=1 Tax=Henosepilachna vigintioctopunctata TaxID=420089 RepID=A0AAW1TNM6_9CUCU